MKTAESTRHKTALHIQIWTFYKLVLTLKCTLEHCKCIPRNLRSESHWQSRVAVQAECVWAFRSSHTIAGAILVPLPCPFGEWEWRRRLCSIRCYFYTYYFRYEVLSASDDETFSGFQKHRKHRSITNLKEATSLCSICQQDFLFLKFNFLLEKGSGADCFPLSPDNLWILSSPAGWASSMFCVKDSDYSPIALNHSKESSSSITSVLISPLTVFCFLISFFFLQYSTITLFFLFRIWCPSAICSPRAVQQESQAQLKVSFHAKGTKTFALCDSLSKLNMQSLFCVDCGWETFLTNHRRSCKGDVCVCEMIFATYIKMSNDYIIS